MKHGFTLVEVLIVVAVLTILATISVLAYDQTQKQAEDGASRAMVGTVRSGLEKYYLANNEYPLASLVHGAAVDGSTPASYTSASQILNVPQANLDAAKFKLIACTPAVVACQFNVLNKARVYYFTKATQTSTTAEVMTTTSGCTYTFPASETGALSYVTAYWSSVDNNWKVSGSDRGNVATSDTSACPLTAL